MPRRPVAARGDVWDADLPGAGQHPVVIATRDSAIPVLSSLVCVLITSTFRGHVAEVEVGPDEGLDHASAVNCDDVFSVRTSRLVRRRGRLGPVALRQFDDALAVALGLD
jgi:mRNA interferase MazF